MSAARSSGAWLQASEREKAEAPPHWIGHLHSLSTAGLPCQSEDLNLWSSNLVACLFFVLTGLSSTSGEWCSCICLRLVVSSLPNVAWFEWQASWLLRYSTQPSSFDILKSALLVWQTAHFCCWPHYECSLSPCSVKLADFACCMYCFYSIRSQVLMLVGYLSGLRKSLNNHCCRQKFFL